MKIRPLVIGDEQKRDIARVVGYAFRNPISLQELKNCHDAEIRTIRQCESVNYHRGDDEMPSIGDDPMRWLVIPLGYRASFSLDEQPAPLGWCRHLSISVIPTERGAYPGIAAVQMISHEFGFHGEVGRDRSMLLYNEEEFQAINLVQSLTPEEVANL